MNKKYFFTIIAIIWIIFIFILSNNNFKTSNQLSYNISNILITITNKIHLTNISAEAKETAIIAINKPLRKIAHMTEYFILAFILYQLLTHYQVKGNIYLITFIFCFIYAMTDEFHQIMVEGRTGQFIDCIIDIVGCVTYLTYKGLKDQKLQKFQ